MTIKKTCDRIIDLYEGTDTENQDRSLVIKLVYRLHLEVKAEEFSNEDLIPILETAKKIGRTKKSLKQILENELLKFISYLPHKLWMKQEEEKKQKMERGLDNKEGQMAESLINFSKEIYEIKLDRDAFSGKRRGYAVQILESVSNYFDVPEFMELCSQSIKSKSKKEFLDTVECLKDYCIEKDIVPNEEIISILDKRIEKTKNRSEAVSGLNLQVETGLISELEALSRLDDWKEKNERW